MGNCGSDSLHFVRFLETEELVSRAQRSNYIKHYFIVIGMLCIVVVCLLFLLLDFGMVSNITIIGNNLQSKKSAQCVSENETKTEISLILRRLRRHSDDSKVREKKRVNEKIDKLLIISEKCRKSGNLDSNCQHYMEEVKQLGELLRQKTELMKKFDKLDDINAIDENELDPNGKQSDDHQSSHKIQPMPKFHEDLDAMHTNQWKMEKDKSMFDAMQHHADNLMPFAAQPDPSAVAQFREKSDDKIITPLKSQSFGM